MSVPTVKSTDQTIGAFGTNTDAISLVRNFVEGVTDAATNGNFTKIEQ